jgi:rhodanese-related sulfurtransferase
MLQLFGQRTNLLANYAVYWQVLVLAFCIFLGQPNGLDVPVPDPMHSSVSIIGLIDFLKIRSFNNPVIIDVRPSDDYQQGHIPSALNLKSEHDITPQVLSSLQNSSIVILYSDGPAAFDSREVYALLSKKKLKSIAMYDGGYQEWLSCSLPVEKTLNQ